MLSKSPAKSKPRISSNRSVDSRYRALAEHSPDVIVFYDLDRRRTYVNPAFKRVFGMSAANALGKGIREFPALPRHAAGRLDKTVKATLTSARTHETTIAWSTEDGNDICMHVHAIPEFDAEGIVSGALIVGRDVSALRNQERELRRREHEFRTLVENATDSIIRYNAECRRLYVNPAFSRLTGIPVDILVGSKPSDYFPTPHADAYEAKIREVHASGSECDFEYRWPDKTGRMLTILVHLSAERDERGQVTTVLAVWRDITALKETERRLELAEAIAHIGHWEWDFETRKTIASNELRRVFRQPATWEATREEVLSLIVEEDREWVLIALNAAYASQSPEVTLDYRIDVEGRLLDMHTTVRIEYGPDDKPRHLLGTTQDMTEVRGYQQRLHSLSFYDAVTGLPNRELFNERLHQAIDHAMANGLHAAVMILDLDHFKTINDSVGHGVGDKVLKEIACRIRRCVRDHDTVARLGGDEFGFVLAELPPEADVDRSCRRILEDIGEACHIDGHEIFLTGSIGIARYPTDGRSISDLLQFADVAMYHAKEAGRNNFQFYAASLMAQISGWLGLAARLRKAQQNGELELYYQPQIDLASGRLLGAEALLRWNHPEDGLIPPAKFIGIAEETGLIVGIGEWVLHEACTTACRWNKRRGKPVKIAVNLSARQFKRNDIVGTVRRVLQDTGCSPDWIELEITESLLLDDNMDIGTALDGLRGLGLSIAIDDFGTGYSALSYIKRFPIQCLKIDRSFVSNIATDRDAAELVKAIIAMARSLRLSLVAEGIEDRYQEEFLKAHGCDTGQGYLFGKPMQAPAFEVLLKASRSSRSKSPTRPPEGGAP